MKLIKKRGRLVVLFDVGCCCPIQFNCKKRSVGLGRKGVRRHGKRQEGRGGTRDL